MYVNSVNKSAWYKIGCVAYHGVGGGESECGAEAEGRGVGSESGQSAHGRHRMVHGDGRRGVETARSGHGAAVGRVHLAVVDVVRHGGAESGGRAGRRRETGEAGRRRRRRRRRLVQRSDDVLEAQTALLLLGFRREFAVARLDALLLHSQRPVHLFSQEQIETESLTESTSAVFFPDWIRINEL